MNYKQLQEEQDVFLNLLIAIDNAIEPFKEARMRVHTKHPETTRVLWQIIDGLYAQYFATSKRLQEVDKQITICVTETEE